MVIPSVRGAAAWAAGEQIRPKSDSAVRQNVLYYTHRFGGDATDAPGHSPLYPPCRSPLLPPAAALRQPLATWRGTYGMTMPLSTTP